MSERSIATRYYGVPEGERAGREKKRAGGIREEIDKAERDGFRLPDKYFHIATEAGEAIAKIASRYVPSAKPIPVEKVYFIPDAIFDRRETVSGTFDAATGIIEVRFSHLFGFDSQTNQTIYERLGLAVTDSYLRLFSEEFENVGRVSHEAQAAHVFAALLSMEELSDFYEKTVPVGPTRELLFRRIAENVKYERAAEFMRRTVDGLFVENSSFDGGPAFPRGLSEEERVMRQLRVIGRTARVIATNRAITHAIEIANEGRMDAVRETLMHEFAHATGVNFLAEFPNGMFDTRAGYDVPSGTLGEDSRFVSLNEACTETIARRALTLDNHVSPPHGEEGSGVVDADANPFEADGAYTNDRLLLQAIVRGIAKAKSETDTVAWKRFERGYFTGDLMQLREIEKTFGQEAWDWYKALTPDTLRKPSRTTRQKLNKHFGLRLSA